ncbi:MAG: hypothetical protein ACYDCK_10290, partial [Thermoplasmatota archaeon]
MRLLALTWALSDVRWGGEPIGAYELLRHLAALDVEIDVVTPAADVARPLPSNVRIHLVKGGARMGHTGANKLAMSREAKRLVASERFDAAH